MKDPDTDEEILFVRKSKNTSSNVFNISDKEEMEQRKAPQAQVSQGCSDTHLQGKKEN